MCSVTAVSLGVTAVSAAMQANSQQQQGKFDSGVADYNARVAENKAESVRAVGVEDENLKRQQTAELLSKQRAQLGAANVDLTVGSASQLQEDTVALGEADALRIRTNYQDQADALDDSAGLLNSQGDYAVKAGNNAATGTILGGAGDVLDTGVSDKWFSPNSSGTSNKDITTSGIANA